MLQGNVPRQGSAEGKWDAKGRRAICLGTMVPKAKGMPKAQSLHVAGQCA
ncbi:hypothetical protein Pyn_12681 [Prunus yedoensis var. nudiflora]|uniref:Uncharacterized protein n=1 Tax=Prunus yedoensis var. nudiflora TaxID=2094558 RepID=A0A314Z219_PRUYE|nr:hypothetical protein Pyn_12681 [Prunus yedoensis var. nudiflora]